MGFKLLLWLAARVLGQTASDVEPAQPADFRPYVFAAYGAVLLLLFLFTLWTTVQLRSVERKLERLGKVEKS